MHIIMMKVRLKGQALILGVNHSADKSLVFHVSNSGENLHHINI